MPVNPVSGLVGFLSTNIQTDLTFKLKLVAPLFAVSGKRVDLQLIEFSSWYTSIVNLLFLQSGGAIHVSGIPAIYMHFSYFAIVLIVVFLYRPYMLDLCAMIVGNAI